MTKLLHKPFRAFTVYALVILACSIPAYYIVVDRIWLEELDEHNTIVKERIEKRFQQVNLTDEELEHTLHIWNTLQPGTTLLESTLAEKKEDSVYDITRENKDAATLEIDRFRGLSSYMEIKGKPYHLVIETNVEEADETMLAITLVTALFFLLLVVGFIILNKRIAKNIWLPFRHTLDKLKHFDLSTGKTISFEETHIEEFAELNHSLQHLIDKNISAYKQQKIFIENASHELQTPLAILKSKIDLLLQQEDMTREQSGMINTLELPLARVSRINKNLLLLAKIENSQFSDTEIVDLSLLLNESLELLTDYIRDKNLGMETHFQPVEVKGNRFLLETLLNNLLTNMIRHTPEGGAIRIDINRSTVSFKNTGTAALDAQGLFERFAVTSPGAANSGLGLAIVKEICNRYGWQITYTFHEQQHSFAVTF